MKSSARVAGTLVLLAIPQASCGTLVTRGWRDKDFVGAYPLSGAATDAVMIAHLFGPRVQFPSFDMSGPEFALVGLLSLPFDLVFDVILLPADLVGWACTCEKTWGRGWDDLE